MKEKDIRILLVDDHDLVLQGLKRIVECSLPEIKTVCTASSGRVRFGNNLTYSGKRPSGAYYREYNARGNLVYKESDTV